MHIIHFVASRFSPYALCGERFQGFGTQLLREVTCVTCIDKVQEINARTMAPVKSDKAFWMTAKFGSYCAGCNGDITIGERIVYDTEQRKAYCVACGVEMIGQDPKPV